MVRIKINLQCCYDCKVKKKKNFEFQTEKNCTPETFKRKYKITVVLSILAAQKVNNKKKKNTSNNEQQAICFLLKIV